METAALLGKGRGSAREPREPLRLEFSRLWTVADCWCLLCNQWITPVMAIDRSIDRSIDPSSVRKKNLESDEHKIGSPRLRSLYEPCFSRVPFGLSSTCGAHHRDYGSCRLAGWLVFQKRILFLIVFAYCLGFVSVHVTNIPWQKSNSGRELWEVYLRLVTGFSPSLREVKAESQAIISTVASIHQVTVKNREKNASVPSADSSSFFHSYSSGSAA